MATSSGILNKDSLIEFGDGDEAYKDSDDDESEDDNSIKDDNEFYQSTSLNRKKYQTRKSIKTIPEESEEGNF